MENFSDTWEQRWHPLREEWVVYSAHRNSRPWEGASEPSTKPAPCYDPTCHLCPNNTRINGAVNPDYKGVYSFSNDHPVVGLAAPQIEESQELYRKKSASGLSRVVCYHDRHDVTMSDLSVEQIAAVMAEWKKETVELAKQDEVNFVFIFENKGEMVGTSSPHPHCQIYATNFCFKHIEQEIKAQEKYEKGNIFSDIIAQEQADGSRIIAENEHAIAFIPFFARYSFEVWIFPKKRHATLASLSVEELHALAEVYQELGRRYDLLYNMSFPYVMSLYQAPIKNGDFSEYHLHFVFLPPLRQAGIKKFPAGPEIGGGNFMCDTMPEIKAAELQAVDLSSFEARK